MVLDQVLEPDGVVARAGVQIEHLDVPETGPVRKGTPATRPKETIQRHGQIRADGKKSVSSVATVDPGAHAFVTQIIVSGLATNDRCQSSIGNAIVAATAPQSVLTHISVQLVVIIPAY